MLIADGKGALDQTPVIMCQNPVPFVGTASVGLDLRLRIFQSAN